MPLLGRRVRARSSGVAGSRPDLSGWRRCRPSTLRRISAASVPCRRGMSSWYFSSTPSVSLMVSGSSSSRSSCDSAVAQSIVSATPGSLNRSSLRSSCTKPTTWRDSRSLAPGALPFRISSSRLQVGIIDPVVEAAALQRVVDLARAVRGDDDDRRLRRLDRADLRNRHLEVRQHLQQIGLERLVGAVELVDQQDRRALGMRAAAPAAAAAGSGSARRRCRRQARRDRARPAPRRAGSRSSGGRSSTRRPPRRRRGPRSIAGGSAAARASSPAPWRSRSCRRRPRLRRTAAGPSLSAR